MAQEMRAEGDAESLVEMLVDHDAAFGKRDTQMRGLDLHDETLEGDGVVVTDGAFLFDGENQIKIDVRLDWDESGSKLFGFNGEALIKLTDVGFFKETIGSLLGFDAVQTKFVAKSALKGLVDAFTAASSLRRISGNGADAQFRESTADLSEMAFEDLAAGLGSEEEMASSVRIQGAEDTVFGNAVFEQLHAG